MCEKVLTELYDPLALSLSKGNSWFDKLTMNDFADLSHAL